MSAKSPVQASHMFSSPMSPYPSSRHYPRPSSPTDTPRSPPSPGMLAMASFQYPLPPDPDEEVPTPDYESEDPAAKSADHTWDSHDPNQEALNSQSSHVYHRPSNVMIPKASQPPPPPQEQLVPDLHPYVCLLQLHRIFCHSLTNATRSGNDIHVAHR